MPRARSALAPKWSISQNGKLVGAVTHVILLCGIKRKKRALPSFLYLDIEFLQEYFEFILRRKAGIKKITTLGIPLFKASRVEKLMFLVNDKGRNIML